MFQSLSCFTAGRGQNQYSGWAAAMKLKEQIRPEGGAHPWIKTTETETLLIDIDLISAQIPPIKIWQGYRFWCRVTGARDDFFRENATWWKSNHVSEITCLVSKHPLVNILNFHYFTWDKTGICSSWKIYVWNDSLPTVGAPDQNTMTTFSEGGSFYLVCGWIEWLIVRYDCAKHLTA